MAISGGIPHVQPRPADHQASHARKMAGKAFKRLLPNEAPMHLGNAAAVHEKCWELNGHLMGVMDIIMVLIINPLYYMA